MSVWLSHFPSYKIQSLVCNLSFGMNLIMNLNLWPKLLLDLYAYTSHFPPFSLLIPQLESRNLPYSKFTSSLRSTNYPHSISVVPLFQHWKESVLYYLHFLKVFPVLPDVAVIFRCVIIFCTSLTLTDFKWSTELSLCVLTMRGWIHLISPMLPCSH